MIIDEIFRNNLIVREWLNGSLFPLNLSLVIVIGLFLFRTWLEAGGSWQKWHSAAGVKTACALWWIFQADGIRAFVVWLLFWVTPRPAQAEVGVSRLDELFLIYAGVIAICAALRLAHLFSPPSWGHRYWLATLLVTVDFSLFTQILRP